MITCQQKFSITILITLYFVHYDYDYDYNNHISWLQSRSRVIKIILLFLSIIMTYYNKL